MSVFDKIKLGLEEAVAYEKGTLSARTTTLSISPVERYRPEEIKEIRHSTGLTQRLQSIWGCPSKRWKPGKQGVIIQKERLAACYRLQRTIRFSHERRESLEHKHSPARKRKNRAGLCCVLG